MEIIKVNKKSKVHIDILFELIKNKVFNISHNRLPSYNEHKNFVASNPYRIWSIIKKNNQPIGSFYINRLNYIGINLIDNSQQNYEECIREIISKYNPLKPIPSVRNKFFQFNVNPENINFIKALDSFNTYHIQNTYLIKKIS